MGTKGFAARTVIWVLAGAGLVSLGPQAPAASSAFQPAVQISEPGQWGRDPQVAINRRGEAVAVWYAIEGSPARIEDVRVHAAIRPAGGNFGPPQTISDPDSSPVDNDIRPDVAIDDAGNAVVIWSREFLPDQPTWHVLASFRPAGGTFGPEQKLNPPGEGGLFPTEAAMSKDGDGVLVWRGRGGGIRASFVKKGSFGATQPVSRGGTNPSVAMDKNGYAVVTWSGDGIEAAFRRKGGSFGTPQQVSDSGIGSNVALNNRGDSVVVWGRYEGDGMFNVQGAFNPKGRGFGDIQTLSEPGRDTHEAQVAMDKQGNAFAVWSYSDGTSPADAAFRPMGGIFGPPLPLSANIRSRNPQIAMDDRGHAIGIWENWVPPGYVWIEAAFGSGGAGFGPVQTLSDPIWGFDPQIALHHEGGAVAVWEGSDGSFTHIDAAFSPAH